MTTQNAMAMQIAIAKRIGSIAGCRLASIDVTMEDKREMIEFRMDGWSPSLHVVDIRGHMHTDRIGTGPHVPAAMGTLLAIQERREATGHAMGAPIPHHVSQSAGSPWRHLQMDASNLRFMIEMREDPKSAIRAGVTHQLSAIHRKSTYAGGPTLREGDVAVCDADGPPRVAVRRAIERYPIEDKCCVIFGQHLMIPLEMPHSVAAQCAGRQVKELADLGPEVNFRRIREAVPSGGWLRVTLDPVWASLDEISQMGADRARQTLGDMVAANG